MDSTRDDQRIRTVLDRLHGLSDAQEDATRSYLAGEGSQTTIGDETAREMGREFWRDKFVALEPGKAAFCVALCRAIGARRVVEAGTSFGVSTIHLAAAVRDNGGGVVVATELEPDKAAVARANFAEAGVDDLVDLRVGDLRETLIGLEPPIDFLLLDIWTPLARPAIEIVGPLMRVGSIVVADNSTARRDAYRDLFDYLEDRRHGFSTMTVPFAGGLEMAVRMS